jgi:hypothetical protein
VDDVAFCAEVGNASPRPGAAIPCGYPSSGFAALAHARYKNMSDEIKVKEIKAWRLELMRDFITSS